ncbi:hypothetical protein [Silvimonas iriomotensis]|uniref:Uncharacterized protein n=1 Tax=Silvimonas iriomotensis TaxID=449662 RepID=A0ABQ2P3Z6_9NEIS|nr:hypothetical protein [Silvimonas iriomotensis]GGP17764.1 hypothetical protein GCM10010970_01430 [Silvimonas iriomotensis]
MNAVFYSAIYTHNTNGKCQKSGIAFHLKFKGGEKTFIEISEDCTYGQLWLQKLLFFVETIANGQDYIFSIKHIGGQPQIKKMAGKIDRILGVAIRLKKPLTQEDVAKLVHKDGRYTKRPNDELYTKIIFMLWQMCSGDHRTYFETHHMPCNQTMTLVKKLHDEISPQKKLFKKKPKKDAKVQPEAPL